VEVAIELIDLVHRFFNAVNQAHQLHIGRQDIAVFFKLIADEVQRTLPEGTARNIQQHHRHQWAFAGLNQCQHFQRFIKGAKPARAQYQRVCLFDEEQFAGEEKVEWQQIIGAVDGGVGMLFEGQGDVETQTVVTPGSFVGGGHDAAAGASDDHHLCTRQRCAEFAGHRV